MGSASCQLLLVSSEIETGPQILDVLVGVSAFACFFIATWLSLERIHYSSRTLQGVERNYACFRDGVCVLFHYNCYPHFLLLLVKSEAAGRMHYSPGAHSGPGCGQGVWAEQRVSQLREWKNCRVAWGRGCVPGPLPSLPALFSIRTHQKAGNTGHPISVVSEPAKLW